MDKYVIIYSSHDSSSVAFKDANSGYQSFDWYGSEALREEYMTKVGKGPSKFPAMVDTQTCDMLSGISDAAASQAALAAKETSDSTKVSNDALYISTLTDIRDDVVTVFGTASDESVLGYLMTWQRMVASPSTFSGAGLKARFARGGLSVDDLLDTDQKVTDYAQACLDLVDSYLVTRMQKLQTFRESLS